MVIGLCIIELLIGEAGSLKDKRRILKSMMDRVKAHHNVSIAEIDQQNEMWKVRIDVGGRRKDGPFQ
jgi:uncharacterized protein YlxP (DUF503 family)